MVAAEAIQSMPNTKPPTPPKPKKQTWRDWLPEDAPEPETLITREELIAEVQRVGESVDVDDIRNWQRAHIIPYGIRRWHNGAMRTLYPVWMIALITELRARQHAGEALAAIAQPLRTTVMTERTAPATVAVAVLPDDIVDRLVAWAGEHAAAFRTNIVRVEVSLVDDHDHPLTFRIPTDAVRLRVHTPTIDELRAMRSRTSSTATR